MIYIYINKSFVVGLQYQLSFNNSLTLLLLKFMFPVPIEHAGNSLFSRSAESAVLHSIPGSLLCDLVKNL